MDSSDPSEQGQKDAFLNGLNQFLSDKGRYLCKSPKLASKTIDLHDLYNRVTSAGGYQKVTEKGFWEDFLEQYGFSTFSVTLAYGLQRIYQTFLEEYERVHFFGDDEASPFARSISGYRRYRYPISDMQRIQNNMNMEKPLVSDYDRVVLSLESCLPNEIDFAVNACTLLSGESRHVLRLPQCRRIVDALLLHAGIVSDGLDSYSGILEELQTKTKHNFNKFWNSSISKKSVLPILLSQNKKEFKEKEDESWKQVDSAESNGCHSENALESKNENQDFVAALRKRLQAIQQSVVDMQDRAHEINNNSTSKWSELFHGHRSLGVQDYEGQRVLQIALVLLNLSFEDFNVVLLAHHPSLLRFVFLCIHSQYSCLRQTGLDILSNISSHLKIMHIHYDIAAMIFDTVHTALLSEDKFERIRGFEILANVCRQKINNDYICVSLSDEVYNASIQNLMINDVELLLSAIEALYRLSKLGETTCTKMIFVRGCIDILMCLVTLNVRTFGSDKLSEIRLARRISPSQQHPTNQGYNPSLQHSSANPALLQRQMNFPQNKFGSAHQAQPTMATMATNFVPGLATPKQHPVRPPLPVPGPLAKPLVHKNVLPPPGNSPGTPVSNVTQANPNQLIPQGTTPQQKPQQQGVVSPPPNAVDNSVIKKSPPGVGPTYTHSEVGTVPPVFHYMPAPPPEIVQDNSPDSFTKLWIWATYEFESESYIPRVDVYCEYLASSNRYGRQGKTEVLSATDFGKCLKQIFPQASSRLFNQGRGQPQYHIAGIKKRATPLPVPGYQLKDPVSVFASSEYEKIPTTPTKPVSVQANNNQTTEHQEDDNSNPATLTIDSSSESAEMQDPQSRPETPSTTQPSPSGVPSSNSAGDAPSTCSSSNQVYSSADSHNPGTAADNECPAIPNSKSDSFSKVSEGMDTSNDADNDQVTERTGNPDPVKPVTVNGPTNNLGNRDTESSEPSLTNGFPQCEENDNDDDKNIEEKENEKSDIARATSAMEVQDDCDEVVNSTKLKLHKPSKLSEESPLVNGFTEESNCADSHIEHVNGVAGEDELPSTHTKEISPAINGQLEISKSIAGELTNSSDSMETVSQSTTPAGDVLSSACKTSVVMSPSQACSPATPSNSLPHSALNQRLKDKIAKRKNSQMTPSNISTVTATSATTPINTSLPPSIIQQYSYRQQPKVAQEEPKEAPSTVLAQQIIPITPQQLQQQYAMQRQHPAGTLGSSQPTVSFPQPATSYTNTQVGTKRPYPTPVGTIPPAKIARPQPGQPPSFTSTPQSLASSAPNQMSFQPRLTYPPGAVQAPQVRPIHTAGTTAHPVHPSVYRPPHPAVPHPAMRPQNPHHIPNPGLQPKPKQPTIDLMAPNASLLVLYRNVGKIPFADHMDEKEDAISKSVRLTASLILTNIARYSDLGRGMLQKHEGHLASVAMSQMDCSPIIARLLNDLNF